MKTLFSISLIVLASFISCKEDSIEPFQDELLLDITNLNPSNFTTSITNPYFTLTPGVTMTYTGLDEDGVVETVIAEVTTDTKIIMGVECVVVFVQEYSDGDLIEETYDWYAQDNTGNVWYFGEAVEDIEDGVVYSTFGSWEAGVDGATPGIIMLADPKIGYKYRQERAIGVAEDQAEIASLTATVTVPFGTFTNCIQTRETNPLDPTFEEYKYYAAGVGFIKAEPLAGGVQELLSVSN